MNNFNATRDRQIELLIKENALKSVEVWLHEQYFEIAKEREALQAKEDKMLETASEVMSEMEIER